MEKYSVLFSLYIKEKPDFLKTAVDSMLSQTVKPDEIVIVEDGPLTDELYGILADYKKNYGELFVYVKNEKNLGLGLALNAGLKVCKNELVARMDTDDIAKPERCEKQLKAFEENAELSIVGGQIEEFIDNVENIVGKRIVPCDDEALKKYIKKRCPFNHMTVMFKKSDVLEVGNYLDMYWNEDYYLWIRLALAGKLFGNLPDILVTVRTGADLYTRRGGNRYFASEKKLQKYMLKNKIIGYPTYLLNVSKRFVVQILMPNKIRGWVFRKFARE